MPLAKLKEVIDLGIYALLPSYADLFKPANKNNRESIFRGAVQEKEIWAKAATGPIKYAPENSGNAVVQFGGLGE